MKFSIITISYNAVKTIAYTLRSVAAQTYREVEHIVVDGNSNDGTQEIVTRYNGCVAKFISEPDNGIYDAMNKGLELSTGDVIGFLNANDVYFNDNILLKVASLMESEELDAVYGDVEFFRAQNPGRTIRRYRSKYFSPKRIAMGWMPAHPSLYMQRRIYDHFGYFDTRYQIAGDFELVARMFHSNTLKYRYLPEVIVRMCTGGISTRGWRNTLLLNQEVLHACRKNGIATNPVLILSKYIGKLMEFLHKEGAEKV